MAPDFNFDEGVQVDEGTDSSSTSEDKFQQVHVSLNHGTKTYNSKEHDCGYCDSGFAGVVVIDRLGRQEEGLDETAVVGCEDCIEKIEEAAEARHYGTEVIRP